MNLKTAVFTAEHGYKWTPPPEGIAESQLSRYGKTIDEAYREGMSTSDYVQGVIYDGSLVAVFSALRTGPGWDTAGRAAKYYALVFIEREQWSQVNFDVLLQNPFFLSPVKNPPVEIPYDGPASAKVDEAVLSLFGNGGKGPERMDFACLGNFLSVHFQLGLNWRFYRSNIRNWHGPELVFEKSLMFGGFSPRTANANVDKAPPVNNCERKDNKMALADSTPDLPSSDVAKFSVMVKCMRQDIDANRGQLQVMAQKIKIMTIAIAALLVINIGLVALVLFNSGMLGRMQQQDDKDDSRSKLEEKPNKRKAKNGSIADVLTTNTTAVGGKKNTTEASLATQNGNAPKN